MDKESAAPAPLAGQTGQPRAIRGTVTVAPSLAGKASATDTLFVFAREMSGPPMPVAIVRATKKICPLRSNSMTRLARCRLENFPAQALW